MQSLFDQSNPPERTLLDELEIIDKALFEGEATPEQESRGVEIVTLCNDVPRLKAEVERLTKELSRLRSHVRFIEKEANKQRRKFWAYKAIDDLYRSLKIDAENDAQEPFDEHFRECQNGLQAVASDPEACTCRARGWHGKEHDSQCPVRIAVDTLEKSSAAPATGLKTRYPDDYQTPDSPKAEGDPA